MRIIQISKCPVCDGSSIEIFLECNDYFASKESYSIAQCNSCTFLFTQDFPSEEEIGRYYDSPNYVSHSDTNKGLVNRLYHSVRSYMLNKKANLIEDLSSCKGGSLLDIGCGTGYFIGKMQSRNWQVSAIEKSGDASAFTKATWGVEPTDLQSLHTKPEAAYDVITMWHVLEHIQPLNETLETVYKALKVDGTLFVALPNAASYDAIKYKEYWAAYDVPRHLWHFTPKTFIHLANNHGFELRKMARMPFDVFYVSMLSEKYKHSSLAFIRALCVGFIGWISSCINIDKTSSIIYVLQKKGIDKK